MHDGHPDSHPVRTGRQDSAIREADPLDGVDDVEWGLLHGPYGTVPGIPAVLRALRSLDDEVRREGYRGVDRDLWHQGTGYVSTVFAAPFMARLLVDPHTPDRHRIASWLRSFAIGHDYDHLPTDPEPDPLSDDTTRLLSELRSWYADPDGWVDGAANGEERAFRELTPHMVHPDAVCLAVHEVLEPVLPQVLTLLSDGDTELRRETAHLLMWFPDPKGVVAPALIDRALNDEDLVVVAMSLVGVGALGSPEQIMSVAGRLLGDDRPEVRFAAAAALVQRAVRTGVRAQDDALVVLAEETLVAADERSPRLPLFYGLLDTFSVRQLCRLSEPDRLRAAELVLDAADQGSDDRLTAAVGAVLDIVLTDPDHRYTRTRFAELPAEDQELGRGLRAVTYYPGGWPEPGDDWTLSSPWGSPSAGERADLALLRDWLGRRGDPR